MYILKTVLQKYFYDTEEHRNLKCYRYLSGVKLVIIVELSLYTVYLISRKNIKGNLQFHEQNGTKKSMFALRLNSIFFEQ